MQTLIPSMNLSYAPSPTAILVEPMALPAIEVRERSVDAVSAPWSCQTTVVIASGSRTAWQWLVSAIAAIGVTMLVPISILIIGLPIAAAVRAILETAEWVARLMVK